jgi:hypothetical protein
VTVHTGILIFNVRFSCAAKCLYFTTATKRPRTTSIKLSFLGHYQSPSSVSHNGALNFPHKARAGSTQTPHTPRASSTVKRTIVFLLSYPFSSSAGFVYLLAQFIIVSDDPAILSCHASEPAHVFALQHALDERKVDPAPGRVPLYCLDSSYASGVFSRSWISVLSHIFLTMSNESLPW